jgi:glycosyltransferase involved in cell wall biosynthesis
MTTQAQPLVSVVTPVYNGEAYLAECIDSVLAQTYSNWEYVIVNNCSKDRTLDIAQEYARKDARIRIHNNAEFLTALQNMNHAFRQMSPDSRYCKALHADDWLFPECLEQMVALAEAHPSIGVVGSYVLEGAQVKCDGLPYPSALMSGRDICRWHLLGKGYVFGSPSSLLIRSDLIRSHDPFYNEANYQAADQEACQMVLQHADFGFVHQVLTYSRVHQESRTSRNKALNTFLLGKLMVLTKYGPVYLSREEYRQRLDDWLRRYYSFLGKRVFRRNVNGFWDYHTVGLKDLGLPLSRARLIRAAIMELIRKAGWALAHPGAAIRQLAGDAKRETQPSQAGDRKAGAQSIA